MNTGELRRQVQSAFEDEFEPSPHIAQWIFRTPEPPRSRRPRWVSLAAALVALLLIGAAGLYVWRVAVPPSVPVQSPPPAAQPGTALVPVWRTQFVTAEDGWAFTKSDMWGTHDGGRTWQHDFAVDYLGIDYFRVFDSKHVIVITRSGNLYVSEDGGVHWHHQRVTPRSGTQGGTYWFINPHEGWLQEFEFDPSYLGATSVLISHTTDAGAHWTEVARLDRDHASSRGLTMDPAPTGGLVFVDARDGLIGASIRDGALWLYVTRDGGSSWHLVKVPPPPGGLPNKKALAGNPVMFGSRGLLFEPAADGTAFVSTTADGGSTWTLARRLSRQPTSVVDADHWWARTDTGIERTADAGATWEHVAITLPPGLQLISFEPIGLDVVWGVAEGTAPGTTGTACFLNMMGDYCAYLVRSSDGGATWELVGLPEDAL